MTVSKDLKITCNSCYESETWDISILKHQTFKSVLKNAGYTKDYKGFIEGTDHYCGDCNDRERETYHVYDGYGEEYLGPIEAWGIVDARKVAWDEFGVENMVKREKEKDNHE